jgi:tetratricopeptide (TPR) repeat protein
MKPENQDQELGRHASTEYGGASADNGSGYVKDAAGVIAVGDNETAKSANSSNFVDVAVSADLEQKLKVTGDTAVGAQIAILPESSEEIAENSTTLRNTAEAPKFASPTKTELPYTPPPKWVPGFDAGLSGANRFKTTDSRFKQIFNALYFGLAGVSCLALSKIYATHLPGLSTTLIGPIGLALWLTFLALAACACFFAIHNRPHESDFQVDLMPHVRRRIRRIGLLIPIPLMFLAVCVQLSQHELAIARHRIDDGRYQKAAKLLAKAIALNPLNEEALAEMALCQNWLYQYNPALEFANRALLLNPADARALADKGWALNRQGKFQEALVPAQTAAKIDPNNGVAFSDWADALVGLGDYGAALAPASKHVELHSREAAAYDQLSDIYDQLGQADEAAANREQANALRDADGDQQ